MQEMFMIANFIDFDSKNFSAVGFYIVFFKWQDWRGSNKVNLPLCSLREESKVRCWEEYLGVLIYRPRSALFRGKAFLYKKNASPSNNNHNQCFIMQLAGSFVSFTTLETWPCLIQQLDPMSIKQRTGSSWPWPWWWLVTMHLPTVQGFQQWFGLSEWALVLAVVAAVLGDAVQF